MNKLVWLIASVLLENEIAGPEKVKYPIINMFKSIISFLFDVYKFYRKYWIEWKVVIMTVKNIDRI
jgi:hypothetical protein